MSDRPVGYPTPPELLAKEVAAAWGVCDCPPGTYTFPSSRYEDGIHWDVRCCGGCGVELFRETAASVNIMHLGGRVYPGRARSQR